LSHLLSILRHPASTLFPYTTLFRSVAEAIPQLKKVARLEVEEVMRVGSSAITLEQWLTLARRINEIFAREPEVKGVVVTHGSNRSEEHTSELQSHLNLVCRLLLEKK